MLFCRMCEKEFPIDTDHNQLACGAAEIRRLRECRTCGGSPHPSGKTCICGGTNFVEEELRQIRLALFAAEQDLATHRALVRALADALRRLVDHAVYVDNGRCSVCGGPGFWPGDHNYGCEGQEAIKALAYPLVVAARKEKTDG